MIRFWAIIRYENQFWSGMIKTAAEGYTDDRQKQAMIFSRGAGRDRWRINGEYLCAAIFFKQVPESFLAGSYPHGLSTVIISEMASRGIIWSSRISTFSTMVSTFETVPLTVSYLPPMPYHSLCGSLHGTK